MPAHRDLRGSGLARHRIAIYLGIFAGAISDHRFQHVGDSRNGGLVLDHVLGVVGRNLTCLRLAHQEVRRHLDPIVGKRTVKPHELERRHRDALAEAHVPPCDRGPILKRLKRARGLARVVDARLLAEVVLLDMLVELGEPVSHLLH